MEERMQISPDLLMQFPNKAMPDLVVNLSRAEKAAAEMSVHRASWSLSLAAQAQAQHELDVDSTLKEIAQVGGELDHHALAATDSAELFRKVDGRPASGISFPTSHDQSRQFLKSEQSLPSGQREPVNSQAASIRHLCDTVAPLVPPGNNGLLVHVKGLIGDPSVHENAAAAAARGWRHTAAIAAGLDGQVQALNTHHLGSSHNAQIAHLESTKTHVVRLQGQFASMERKSTEKAMSQFQRNVAALIALAYAVGCAWAYTWALKRPGGGAADLVATARGGMVLAMFAAFAFCGYFGF